MGPRLRSRPSLSPSGVFHAVADDDPSQHRRSRGRRAGVFIALVEPALE